MLTSSTTIRRLLAIKAPIMGLLLLACVVSPVRVSAGLAPARLNCESVDQKTRVAITGVIPGDEDWFDLKFKHGKEVSELKGGTSGDSEEIAKLRETDEITQNRRVFVVADFTNRVFTLALRANELYDFRLYALPTTIRVQKGPNRTDASFVAILLEAPIPGLVRTSNADWKPMRMRCTYKHSV